MELGGFAEVPADIDGTEEDLNAFNYCLAEDYLSAIYTENFDDVGDVGLDTIESVVHWLNYDGEINVAIADEIEKIPKGQYITIKNRTLEAAVIEKEHVPLAEVFIYNGNLNPKLFLIVMEKGDPPLEEESKLINVGLSGQSTEGFVDFLKSIFEEIEERYKSLTSLSEKKVFLEQIKPYIKGIRIPKKHAEDERVKEFIKMRSYSWQLDIKKK